MTDAQARAGQAKSLAKRLNSNGWMDAMIAQVRDHQEVTRKRSDQELASNRPSSTDYSDESLIDSAARVAEAIARVIGVRLFDTQIRAGLVMSIGGIAEMQTGEGKTLSGVLPVYVHSVRGGVHVATPNAYLASRDHELLRDIYSMLGLTSALVTDELDDANANQGYRADVTFAASHTFGFDFLKDSLVEQAERSFELGARFLTSLRGQAQRPRRQRRLNAAIIDEVDDVLLDDAISPLILSGRDLRSAIQSHDDDLAVLAMADHIANKLDLNTHYQLNRGGRPTLSALGLDVIYRDFVPPRVMNRTWHEYVQNALHAKDTCRRDIHYIVREDKIQLIDGATGRLFSDRTWTRGLQQAVETREGIDVTPESTTLAKITKQDYFRRYRFLTGMTGTAAGCESEFARTYGMPVIPIRTRSPSRRMVLPMQCYRTKRDKYNAIVQETVSMANQDRAVLIGTLNIDDSFEISRRLDASSIKHQILNGVQDADEAAVIEEAGTVRQITVATSLAGRGTDIALDVNVRDKGGLHVIVSEMHAFSRVDRQLIGRGARCGDPGSARCFVSAEDQLLIDHAPWIVRAIKRRCSDGEVRAGAAIENAIHQLQQQRQSAMADRRADALEADTLQSGTHVRNSASSRDSSVSKNRLSSSNTFNRPTDCWAI